MTSKIHIFITGATGYIGGAVLERLLNHPKADSFQITAVVRSHEKAKQFQSLGVTAVVGSLSDDAKLAAICRDSDVVFSCADADDLEAVQAMLRGLRKRHEHNGDVPIFIHTSGTGVISTSSDGLHATETIYSDLNIKQIESLPVSQPHRIVDIEVVEADEEGYVRTYIVLPSTIYGIAKGRLVDLGIQNPYSQQIPGLIRAGLARGQGGVIGEGKNIWPNVHIDDVAEIYIKIFDLALQSLSRTPITPADEVPTPAHFEHGQAGFYFGENGEHTLLSLASAVASAIHAVGKGKFPEPVPFTEEELQKYLPGGGALDTNSRCRAERSRGIGWKPKYGTNDMLESVKEDVRVLAAKY